MKLTCLLCLAVTLCIGTVYKKNASTSKHDDPIRTVFFDKQHMDKTVNPSDDFFLYANGNWMKRTEVPAAEAGWGSFYTLAEENLKWR